MSNIPVSLVIPTYNRGHLISETIDSALAQSKSFHEIIIVDDGSTDDTENVLGKYGKLIRKVRIPNQGVQAARNVGIQKSSCDLIVLCDSDDLLDKEYLSFIAPWMTENKNQDVLYTNFNTFRQNQIDSEKLGRASFDFLEGARMDGDFAFEIPHLYARSVRYQPMFPSGMMARRSFFETIGGYDPKFNGVGSEDWEFTLRAINKGNIAICKRPLVRIRKHSGNSSGNLLKTKLGEIKILEHALSHHASAQQIRREIEQSILRRRCSAFATAYAEGKFPLAILLSQQIEPDAKSVKAQVKEFICNLPESLRNSIWKLTQQIGKPQDTIDQMEKRV